MPMPIDRANEESLPALAQRRYVISQRNTKEKEEETMLA